MKIHYRISTFDGSKLVEGDRFTRVVHGKKEVFALRRMEDDGGFSGWCVDHVRTGYGAGRLYFGSKAEMRAVFEGTLAKLTPENAQTIFNTATLNEEYA